MAKTHEAPAANRPAAPGTPSAKPQAQQTPEAAKPNADAPQKRVRGGIEWHESEAAAMKVVDGRTTGARRAFKVTLNGKDTFLVAAVPDQAWRVACEKLVPDLKVVECGKTARAPKALGMAAVMEAISSMPEDDQKRIRAQLEKLSGGAQQS